MLYLCTTVFVTLNTNVVHKWSWRRSSIINFNGYSQRKAWRL